MSKSLAVLAAVSTLLAATASMAEPTQTPSPEAYRSHYTNVTGGLPYHFDALQEDARRFAVLKASLKRQDPVRYARAEEVASLLRHRRCGDAFQTAKAAGDVEMAGKVAQICRGEHS